MFILVMPNGKKLWRLTYRFAGKQTNLLSGGPYPIVKLADAREWRDEVKGQLLEGRDPSAIRKAEKKAPAAKGQDPFEIVAREWRHTRSRVWSERYARITRTRFEQDIFPGLGSVPIADIVAAQRCRSDPSRDIVPAMIRPAPVKHRAKVDACELPVFFAKLAQDEETAMSHLALRWTILKMVRTQETRLSSKPSQTMSSFAGSPRWMAQPLSRPNTNFAGLTSSLAPSSCKKVRLMPTTAPSRLCGHLSEP